MILNRGVVVLPSIQHHGSWLLSRTTPLFNIMDRGFFLKTCLNLSLALAWLTPTKRDVLHRRCNHSDMRVLHNSVHLGCSGEGPALKLCGEPSCALSCRLVSDAATFTY